MFTRGYVSRYVSTYFSFHPSTSIPLLPAAGWAPPRIAWAGSTARTWLSQWWRKRSWAGRQMVPGSSDWIQQIRTSQQKYRLMMVDGWWLMIQQIGFNKNTGWWWLMVDISRNGWWLMSHMISSLIEWLSYPTPLKNDGVGQLGLLFPTYGKIWKHKNMFQTTNFSTSCDLPASYGGECHIWWRWWWGWRRW